MQNVLMVLLAVITFSLGVGCIISGLMITFGGDSIGGAIGAVCGFMGVAFALNILDERGML